MHLTATGYRMETHGSIMMKKATSNLSPESSGARRVPHTSLHWGLFTDCIEAVVPARSSEEIQIELEAKLQLYLLPETG